jgi:hypothetical protein
MQVAERLPHSLGVVVELEEQGIEVVPLGNGRISIRRPWRTVTSPRDASAPITSRAVVFETPNSAQMSCSVGARSSTPMSALTILPARTRVTWSLSLRD